MKNLLKFLKSLWLGLLNAPDDTPGPAIKVCGPIPINLAVSRVCSFCGMLGGCLRSPRSMPYWEDYLEALGENAKPYAIAMRDFLIENPMLSVKMEPYKFSDGTVAIFTESFWNEFLIAIQLGSWNDRMQIIKKEINLPGAKKQTGTTTAQMLAAPKGAVYVWPWSNSINYPKALAAFLGRLDLLIISNAAFNKWSMRGVNCRVVVDHACRLDWDQLQLLREIQHKNGDRHDSL